MKRLLTLALVMVLSAPALAFDVGNMSADERSAFEAAIREYLLTHPEVIFEAVDVYEQRQKTQQAQDDAALIAANSQAIFSDGHSWVGGNPDGDITIVEFLDYKCTYCKKAYNEVTELIETDGNIRFVVKEFPILGEESLLAAKFAIAVQAVGGDAAYEAVHNQLMTMRGAFTQATLSRLASQNGLDMGAIAAEMESEATAGEIRANYELARLLDINGTPGFIFESEMIRGYAPLDAMRQVVERVRG